MSAVRVAAVEEPESEYPASITRPSTGFLGSYTSYAADLTDAPYIYHLMCGLAALATAAGNSVYLNVWSGLLRLNLWVVLIGESGEMHKSEAIRPEQRLILGAVPERRYPNSFSVEALEAAMAKQPAGQLTASELAHLWTLMGKDYNKSGLQFLMVMHDGEPYVRSTKGEGISEIKGGALTILAGSTPDWLMEGLNGRDQGISSGAIARFIIVPATQKEQCFGLITSHVNPQLEAALADHLKQVTRLKGEMKVTPAARLLFDRWEDEVKAQIATGKLVRELAPHYRRMSTAALKIAALYGLAESPPCMEVTGPAMQTAINLMAALMDSMTALFGSEVAFTRSAGHAVLVRRRLREAGGCLSHRDLYRKVRYSMNVREFDLALDGMRRAEEINEKPVPTKGRTATQICLVKAT